MATRAFKYRLYPTKSQTSVLNETLELCRQLYNGAIEERKDAWKKGHIFITLNNQTSQLPAIKTDRSEYHGIYAQVSQDVLRRVDAAFKTFFRRVKTGQKAGYPRFRGRGWYDSFTYPQSGFSLGDNSITLSKIGAIKNMVRNHCLAKSITDAAWRQFTDCLSYKAESAGRKFVAVNPVHTSQQCSQCGSSHSMPLSERTFTCYSCGLSLNRDHNSALNILAIGLDSLGLSSLKAPDFL